jgi:tRNA(adenine34) deaminase
MASEERYMRQALVQARRAWEKGEVPVGAVLVAEGRVLSRGRNQPIGANDPTAHAEIMAIRKAGRVKNNYRLSECDLYVTLEPCAMCLGAIVQARLRRVVYGAADPKAGAVRSVMKFPFERLNHRPEVRGGLLAEECRQMLKHFFKARRSKSSRRGPARTISG